MTIEQQNEILNQIENINLMLDSMTIYAIHNTARGEYLQNRLERLRAQLKSA